MGSCLAFWTSAPNEPLSGWVDRGQFLTVLREFEVFRSDPCLAVSRKMKDQGYLMPPL